MKEILGSGTVHLLSELELWDLLIPSCGEDEKGHQWGGVGETPPVRLD